MGYPEGVVRWAVQRRAGRGVLDRPGFFVGLDKRFLMSGLELVFGFILFAGVFHMAKAMIGSKALENLRKLAGGKAAVAAAPAPRNGRLASKPAPVAVEEEEEDEDEVEEDEDDGDDDEEEEEEEEEDETPPTIGKIRGKAIPVVEDEDEEEPLGDLLHALCTIVEVIRDNADDILERLKG